MAKLSTEERVILKKVFDGYLEQLDQAEKEVKELDDLVSLNLEQKLELGVDIVDISRKRRDASDKLDFIRHSIAYFVSTNRDYIDFMV